MTSLKLLRLLQLLLLLLLLWFGGAGWRTWLSACSALRSHDEGCDGLLCINKAIIIPGIHHEYRCGTRTGVISMAGRWPRLDSLTTAMYTHDASVTICGADFARRYRMI